MMYRNQYQDHLKTCGYCQNQKEKDHKAKLVELGHMIKGTRPVPAATKGASSYSYSSSDSHPRLTLRYHPILSEKQKKLKELGKMIRDI